MTSTHLNLKDNVVFLRRPQHNEVSPLVKHSTMHHFIVFIHASSCRARVFWLIFAVDFICVFWLIFRVDHICVPLVVFTDVDWLSRFCVEGICCILYLLIHD